MPEPDDEDVKFQVRLPRKLHRQVQEFANGSPRRPRTSLNAAIVFLVERALQREKQLDKEAEEKGELGSLQLAAAW
jgi:predicted transcriptional regulator